MDLGRLEIVPGTSPTRHGTPTSAHKGPKSRPRSGQGGPRAAHDRPKASQGAPKMWPRGSQAVAKPSPASPKTQLEHDLGGQLFLTRSSVEFCSVRASRVLRVTRINTAKSFLNCGCVTSKAFQQCTRRDMQKQRKNAQCSLPNRGFGAPRPFKIEPGAAQEPKKTPKSKEKRTQRSENPQKGHKSEK